MTSHVLAARRPLVASTRLAAVAAAWVLVVVLLVPSGPVAATTQPPGVDLSPAEYLALFDEATLPGTSMPAAPPVITGNTAADARIRSIAEARGYRLRPVVNTPLDWVGGHGLHPGAAAAWRSMAAAAAADGVSMHITSGYRSVAAQRQIFLNRLGGWSPSQIAAGSADGAISNVLRFNSIPGYSKHHTGYAVDIGSPQGSFLNFRGTPAHRWLTADGYANARRFGFIPSYPDGGSLMGPEPEPWEYVYVGIDALRASAVRGSVDLVEVSPGRLRVAGWTYDRREPGRPLAVHAYLHHGGTSAFLAGVHTSVSRPDVGAAFGVGATSGFELVGSVSVGGPAQVCAHAIAADGLPVLVGCRSVTLQGPALVGSLDVVAAAPGGARVAGWTFDRVASGRTVDVHVWYRRGEERGFVAGFPASSHRGDVAAVFGVGERHGFNRTLSLSPGPVELCVHALAVAGERHRLLGCRTVTVG